MLFGTRFIGAANTIYGILLIVFIIFMPQGIVGADRGHFRSARSAASLEDAGEVAAPAAAEP